MAENLYNHSCAPVVDVCPWGIGSPSPLIACRRAKSHLMWDGGPCRELSTATVLNEGAEQMGYSTSHAAATDF